MANPVDDLLAGFRDPAAQPPQPVPAPDFGRGPAAEVLSAFRDPTSAYVKDKARGGASFADVAGEFKQSGAELGPRAEQYFNLEAARGQHATEDEGTADYLARRLPGGGAVGQVARDIRFSRVVEKYQKGEATKDDLDFLARYERLKEIDRERESTVGGAVLNKASYLPALIGEAYVAGRVPLGAAGRGTVGANLVAPAIQAQLIPSFTARAAGERVAEQGGNIYDAKNLAPAAAMSALQNVVLHRVGSAGKDLPLGQRVAAGVGTGVGGQQGVDILGGAADLALSDSYKTKTRFGLLGQILHGETDDALKNAASQVVMFAAFSLLGGKPSDPLAGTEFYRPGAEPAAGLPPGEPPPGLPPQGPHPVYGAFADLVNDLSGRGYTRARVGAEAQKVGDWFQQQREANPLLTRAEVLTRFEDSFKGQRDSVLKFGRAVADAAFPEKVVSGFTVNKPGEAPPEPSKPKVNVTTGFPESPNESGPPESRVQTAIRQRLTEEAPQRALERSNSPPALPPAEGPVGGEIAPQRRGQGLKLGEGVPLKPGMEMDPAEAHAVQKWGDGRVFRFPVHDGEGKRVGSASIVEEEVGNGQVDIHVPWASGSDMAGGEGRGKHPFGPREIFAVARQVAELVPNARFLKYQASEGRIRSGQARVLDLDRFRPKPAEPVGRPKPVGGGSPPEKGFVVAAIGADGKVYYGHRGDIHNSLAERFPGIDRHVRDGRPVAIEMGFAGPEGRFLTRDEAAAEVDRLAGLPVPRKGPLMAEDIDPAAAAKLAAQNGPKPVDENLLAAMRRNPERDAAQAMQGPVGPPRPPMPLTPMQRFMQRGRQPAAPGQPVESRIQPGATPPADVPRSPLLDQPDEPAAPPPLTHESLKAMDRADRDRVMAEKGLSDEERHVIHERLAESPRSFGRIAQDQQMMAGRTRPLSRQRVKQIEEEGLKRLDLKESIDQAVHAKDRADEALDKAEDGQRIVPGDLGVDPAEVGRRVKKRADAWQRYYDQVTAVADQLERAVNDARAKGLDLTPAERAAFDARLAGIRRPDEARLKPAGQQPVPLRAPVPADVPAQGAKAPGGPAATGGRAASLGNLKQNREGRSFVRQLQRDGGLDPDKFIAAIGRGEFDIIMDGLRTPGGKVKRKGNPFIDASGNRGRRHPDDVMSELARDGIVRTEFGSHTGAGGAPDAGHFLDLLVQNPRIGHLGGKGAEGQIAREQAAHDQGPGAVDDFLNFDPKQIEAEAALKMAKWEIAQKKKARLRKDWKLDELQGGIPGARELYEFAVRSLTWLAKYRGAVPRVPIQFDTQHILPRWGNYADWKAAHATPEGLGRFPILARLFDPRGVAFEPVDRSIIARAAAVENGKTLAALWAAANKPGSAAWKANPDGTVMLLGNRRGYLSDVVEAELRRPGSQPLTPEQRQWVRGVYEPLLADLHDLLSQEGVKGWVDSAGNPSPLSRFYFPRPAVGKEGYAPPSEAGAPPKGASSPGAKSFFQKSRSYATEEEGAKDGLKYDPDPVSRVAKMIAGAYRAVADHRLANDPDLGAMPAAAHVWLETRPVNVAPAFQGKVFPVEVAKRLESAYGQARNPMIQMAESVAAAGKGMVLGLDYGVIFNQMLPVFFRHPVLWGKATVNGAKAMFDPLVMSKYLARPENATAASEFAQGGGTLGRLSDFAAGLEKGEFATRVPLVGKGYEVAGRMLGVAMDVSKIELWKARRTVTQPQERASVIEAIENMVGGGRMESIGQAPWWTLAQRMLFLAPSLYRSGLGLVATAFQRGAAGKLTREALGAYLAGVALIAYGAMKAAGLDDDEVAERFDPRTGKFLKVPIKLSDGSSVNVGFSHIFISFARLAGMIEKEFEGDNPIDTGADGNPVLRWYRGHAGTLPRIFIDLFTGKDFQGNRTGIGESGLKAVEPLAAQTLLHGDGSVTEKGVGDLQPPKYANAVDAALSVLGLQAQPESSGAIYRHVLNDQAKTQFGKGYDQLTLREQAEVIRTVKRSDAAPKKPDPSPALIERAHAVQVERQHRLTGLVSDEARRNLSALGATVPGYSGTVHVNGVDVPLTHDRQQKLEGLLVEEYNRAASLWPVERWQALRPDQRKKVVSESLEAAGQRARHRLLAGG